MLPDVPPTPFRSRAWTRRTPLPAAVALMALMVLALVGCGEPRTPAGDPGGVPVAFVVQLEQGYVRGMSSAVSSSMRPLGPRGHWHVHRHGDPRYRHFGRRETWVYHVDPDPWHEPQFTDVYLLAGDGPAEAGLFRTALPGGERRFSVPIRPGRVVTLTIQARGAREGWEAVGHFTATGEPGQEVALALTADGPRMTVSPSLVGSSATAATTRPDETTAPEPAASATAGDARPTEPAP